ncbi:MAG TPA: hypothetical protein VIH61_06570 [Waddliaceae bacterium]
MPLSVTQAVTVADYFRVSDESEQEKIKRLTTEQRNICYQAFKVVARVTQKDFDSLEQYPLDENVINEIGTSLNAPLAGEEPADHAWYAKPFYFIAHKISSLAKGFANIFWRTGSIALYEKAGDYRVDIDNYKQKILNYRQPSGDGEDKKQAGYLDIGEKIKSAQNVLNEQNGIAQDLEAIYECIKSMETSLNRAKLQNKRFELKRLSEETLLKVPEEQNEKEITLFHIAQKALKDWICFDGELENKIFGPTRALLKNICDENKEKERGTNDICDENKEKERDKDVLKELHKAAKKVSKEYDSLVVDENGALAKARDDLEAKVAKQRSMEAKEKLLRAKYPALSAVSREIMGD